LIYCIIQFWLAPLFRDILYFLVAYNFKILINNDKILFLSVTLIAVIIIDKYSMIIIILIMFAGVNLNTWCTKQPHRMGGRNGERWGSHDPQTLNWCTFPNFWNMPLHLFSKTQFLSHKYNSPPPPPPPPTQLWTLAAPMPRYTSKEPHSNDTTGIVGFRPHYCARLKRLALATD